MQIKLAETEQWPAARMLAYQFNRIGILVEHVHRTAPFYRERLAAAGIFPGRTVTPTQWRRLAPLTRRDIQQNGDSLLSGEMSPEHGAVSSTTTSGSTGMPVSVRSTEFAQAHFSNIALRYHLWHGRDFAQKIGLISKLLGNKSGSTNPVSQNSWGDRATYPFPTGPSVLIDVANSVERQIDLLEKERPVYIVTYPSILAKILEAYAATGRPSPGVRQVLCFGEILPPELRTACWRIWNIPITDSYSAQEVGGIALQCPEHEHYYVQSEAMLVEVIDEAGQPARPGAIGRIVVTPLHNFAMPLLRYDIGDYAELGGPCDCGRTLPVLRRILGRTRNMLVAPDGQRYWPAFGTGTISRVAPVVQHQFIQTDATRLEVHLVTARPLSEEEQTQLADHIRARLPYPFEIVPRFCDDIPRSAGGKFEFFRSELDLACP